MSSPIISVRNLGKRYRLGATVSHDTLRDAIAHGVKRLLGRDGGHDAGERSDGAETDEIWALRNVTFDVEEGEVVGVIGHNGAGKTTLLKILSRITEPTEGEARLRGRVASLLEVGTGFHPELTGRENIYLNGAILGMTKKEIDAKFDEIVAFSEVGRFLDTPVKRYSSGMYVRLAFAVAAHLEPEILLVDEVLAVGDVGFQKKCLGKMGEVARGGRTVFFVSHNLGAVRALCRRVLLFDHGRLLMDGPTEQVVECYLGRMLESCGVDGRIEWSPGEAPGTESIRIRSVVLRNADGQIRNDFLADEPIEVEFEYDVFEPLRGFRFHLTLMTQQGETAFRTTDHMLRQETLAPGRYRSRCTIPARLLNCRRYTILLGGGIPNVKAHLRDVPTVTFEVRSPAHGSMFPENWPGAVAPALEWEIDLPVGRD